MLYTTFFTNPEPLEKELLTGMDRTHAQKLAVVLIVPAAMPANHEHRATLERLLKKRAVPYSIRTFKEEGMSPCSDILVRLGGVLYTYRHLEGYLTKAMS